MSIFMRFLKDESGATAIEYALIAGLIAVVLIGTIGFLEDDITELFGRVGDELDLVDPAPNAVP